MIASLPMYDRPETRAAHDRLWANIRDTPNLAALPLPKNLTRDGALSDHWTNPSLFLSQTCSLPFRSELRNKVTLLATPVHDLSCPAGYYYSVIVARCDDARVCFAAFNKSTLAFNAANSQSGWAAPAAMAEKHGIVFAKTLRTGAHENSARAVVDDTADLAAIDAVTWKLMSRHAPWTRRLKVVATTPSSPALPYITAKGNDTTPIYEALANAIDALSDEDRETLCLKGLTKIKPQTYLALPIPSPPD